MEEEIQNQSSKQLNVQVAVRIRPLSLKETSQNENICLQSTPNQVTMIQSSRLFSYDNVFNQESQQEEIFQKCVSNLVIRCFEGYNSTLLAYGQTGSGKTYTMGTTGLNNYNDPQDFGMIPRVIHFIFEEIEKRKQEILISCSYLELYNEQIIDLFNESSAKDKCPPIIREEKDHTISILNLTNIVVNNPQEMIQELNRGGNHRTTAETKMNESSSRSHAIFTIYFTINSKEEVEENDDGQLSAKFHFVDLAGSERLKKTQAIGKLMEEGININQSLLVLGNVIKTLSDKRKNNQIHIPYRESKLTRILQDSLGGNSNTYMIACVSPAESNYEETLNTLKYASRAREIQNKPTQNRDPHSAQIFALKQNIVELQQQIAQFKKLLQDNNINVDIIQFQQEINQGNCLEHNDIIRKQKQTISQYEKQLNSQKAQLNQFSQLQKTLTDSEYERYKTQKQKDSAIRQLQDARKLLQKYSIPYTTTEEVGTFDGYYNEIQMLKMDLIEKDKCIANLQADCDSMIRDSQRDQRILCFKQKELMNLQRKFERLKENQEESFQQDSELEEEFPLNESQIKEADQQIDEYESNLQDVTQLQNYLKKQLAEDMKNQYLTQISVLESQKAQLLKQVNNKQDSAQVNDLKSKISDYEGKIQEMRMKEQQQKQMQKKLEDQDNQVKELKNNIEKIKRQKVDLIKKMKAENEKFIKEKDEKHKELILAKKSKIQQDALVSKLRNDNQKKDILIKRKEDELNKQKSEKILNKQNNNPKNAPKLLQFSTFENQIENLFKDLVEGIQAENQNKKEFIRLQELQDEVQQIEKKLCQFQIKKEQIQYDILQNVQLIDQQNLIEMELSSLTINRETLNETIDYQIHKIDTLQKQATKSYEYYQVFLTNSYFKELPNWCTRSFKYIIDNWVKNNIEMQNNAQQLIELQYTNQELQKDSQKQEGFSPIQKKKIIKSNQSVEVQELRKQLNDFKKKYQISSNENKQIHIELEYYKKFYTENINKNMKDKNIGICKTDSVNQEQSIQHSQSYHAVRETYKLEKQKSRDQNTSLNYSKTMQSVGSGGKIIKTKSASERDQWLSEQMNCSVEMFDNPFEMKYELVKSIQAHENPILSVYSWENFLYSTSFKQIKLWDIDTQKLISSLDQNTYVRAICNWPEKNCFALSHGSQVTLYDQNTLMCLGVLKSSIDEIRVLSRHNGMLVVGGKGTQSNSINVWDYRSNNILYEFEKSMDVLSVCQSDSTQELYWGTFNHNVKKMQLNIQKQGQISQMAPPHYDKVTGVGLLDNWIVSCSFGKGMRMWNQFSGQQGQANSDIHKDSINSMTIDQNLKIIYTGSKDGQLKAIRINENKFNLLHDLTASSQSINSLNVLNQNSYVISGGSDKMIKIWRPSKQSYELMRQLAQTVGDFQIEEEQ